jgi:hypothetical protein
LLSLLLVCNLSAAALANEKPSEIAFNIPEQRADLSLISFAEQADITLLFPIDKMAGKVTNPLRGQYNLDEALRILLQGTGLKPVISESGQVSILIDPTFESNDDMANYKKNKVATAVIAVVSTVAVSPAFAVQEKAETKTEVIEVRGIRGALGRAMDSKREAGGVVDSISAEDIGKFPDTNLAESLQRITGAETAPGCPACHGFRFQRVELGHQLRVLRVVGQALGGGGHGAGIVAHAAQHAYPLAPSHGLSGVALQRDQLLKSNAGGRPI